MDLARFLVGALLVRDAPEGRVSARIVETEAYLAQGDAASHSRSGETARNRSMFLARGHAYVYFIYGSAYCLNVASARNGVGEAVLLRAAEPLEGLELMRKRRPKAKNDAALLRGPGNLAAAFGLDRRLDGADLCEAGSELYLARGTPPAAILETERIGISRDAHHQLRFLEAGSPFASGPKRPRA